MYFEHSCLLQWNPLSIFSVLASVQPVCSFISICMWVALYRVVLKRNEMLLKKKKSPKSEQLVGKVFLSSKKSVLIKCLIQTLHFGKKIEVGHFFLVFNFYFFTWLHWVSVAACRISSLRCGMWGL